MSVDKQTNTSFEDLPWTERIEWLRVTKYSTEVAASFYEVTQGNLNLVKEFMGIPGVGSARDIAALCETTGGDIRKAREFVGVPNPEGEQKDTAGLWLPPDIDRAALDLAKPQESVSPAVVPQAPIIPPAPVILPVSVPAFEAAPKAPEAPHTSPPPAPPADLPPPPPSAEIPDDSCGEALPASGPPTGTTQRIRLEDIMHEAAAAAARRTAEPARETAEPAPAAETEEVRCSHPLRFYPSQPLPAGTTVTLRGNFEKTSGNPHQGWETSLDMALHQEGGSAYYEAVVPNLAVGGEYEYKFLIKLPDGQGEKWKPEEYGRNLSVIVPAQEQSAPTRGELSGELEQIKKLKQEIAAVYVERLIMRMQIWLLDENPSDKRPLPPDQFDLRAELGLIAASCDRRKAIDSVVFKRGPYPEGPKETSFGPNVSIQCNLARHRDAEVLREELVRQEEESNAALYRLMFELAKIENRENIERTAQVTVSKNIYVSLNGSAYGINEKGEIIRNGSVWPSGDCKFGGFVECTKAEFGRFLHRLSPGLGGFSALPLRFFKELDFDAMSADSVQDYSRKFVLIRAELKDTPGRIFPKGIDGQEIEYQLMFRPTPRMIGTVPTESVKPDADDTELVPRVRAKAAAAAAKMAYVEPGLPVGDAEDRRPPRESPRIELPADRRSLLEAKLKEYRERFAVREEIEEFEAPQVRSDDSVELQYRIRIIERLLRDGFVNTFDLSKELSEEFGGIRTGLFNHACGVINDYCTTGGKNLVHSVSIHSDANPTMNPGAAAQEGKPGDVDTTHEEDVAILRKHSRNRIMAVLSTAIALAAAIGVFNHYFSKPQNPAKAAVARRAPQEPEPPPPALVSLTPEPPPPAPKARAEAPRPFTGNFNVVRGQDGKYQFSCSECADTDFETIRIIGNSWVLGPDSVPNYKVELVIKANGKSYRGHFIFPPREPGQSAHIGRVELQPVTE